MDIEVVEIKIPWKQIVDQIIDDPNVIPNKQWERLVKYILEDAMIFITLSKGGSIYLSHYGTEKHNGRLFTLSSLVDDFIETALDLPEERESIDKLLKCLQEMVKRLERASPH